MGNPLAQLLMSQRPELAEEFVNPQSPQIQQALASANAPLTHEDADPLFQAGAKVGATLPEIPQMRKGVDKAQIFRTLLADFLQNVGTGLASAGTGPGAGARAAGAAITAGPERETRREAMNFRQQQLELERQNQQSLAAQRQATAQMSELVPVTLSDGRTIQVPLRSLGSLVGQDIATAQRGKTATEQITSKEKITDKTLASKEKIAEKNQEIQRARNAIAERRLKMLEKRGGPTGTFRMLVDNEGNITGAMNNRTLQFVPLDIAGSRLSPTSSAELDRRTGISTMLNSLEVVEDFLRESPAASAAIGPVAGRVGRVKELLIDDHPEAVQLRQATEDISDVLLRLRSGAQINENEYARLRKLIPTVELPMSTFVARLNGLKRELGVVASTRQTGKVNNPNAKFDSIFKP